jgi:hypothetical protein
MEEPNRFKFYLAKYFFLALSVLQGLAALLMILQFEDTPKNRSAVFVFFALCMIFLSLHFLLSRKIKRVVINKKKIAILFQHKTRNYDWSEVKEMKFLPFLNMYSLKLKGKNNRIYFLPNHESEALFGLFSAKADFIPKRVSKA